MENHEQGQERVVVIEKATRSKGIVVVALAVLILIVVGAFLLSSFSRNEEPEIDIYATILKIIDISELSTYQVIYNGVAEVKNGKKPEKTDYYVAYNATVKAGIDFEDVVVSVNESEKKIVVALPEIELTQINVDAGSLDYIFVKDRANTETVSAQAYKLCEEDVANECSSETAIHDLARENAEHAIEALVRPFMEQLDAEYTLEFK